MYPSAPYTVGAPQQSLSNIGDMSSAVAQAQGQLSKLMNAPINNAPIPSLSNNSYPVGTIGSGSLIQSDGSVQPSPTQNNLQTIQNSTAAQIGPPNLLNQLRQYQTSLPMTMPMQAHMQLQQQQSLTNPDYANGETNIAGNGDFLANNLANFTSTGNVNPQDIQDNLTQNANLQQNLPNSLFTLSDLQKQQPQDPMVAFIQKILQNNPMYSNSNINQSDLMSNTTSQNSPFELLAQQPYTLLSGNLAGHFNTYNLPTTQNISPQTVGGQAQYFGTNALPYTGGM